MLENHEIDYIFLKKLCKFMICVGLHSYLQLHVYPGCRLDMPVTKLVPVSVLKGEEISGLSAPLTAHSNLLQTGHNTALGKKSVGFPRSLAVRRYKK